MKTAIVYYSKHGTTEKVAGIVSEKLNDSVELIDLQKKPAPSLEKYDRIIIGGSIYAGAIQKQIKDLCSSNMDLLLSKELGLFICCMTEENDKKLEAFNNAFPEALRKHSKAKGFLGGEMLLEKLNFFERLAVRLVAKVKKSVSKINYPAIEQFAASFKMPQMLRSV